MSEYIEVGQPLQFTDPNTPTRVGEIVENVSDIYNIPSPRLGMQVFVKSEKKSYVITSLKSKVIGGVDVPEAAVEAFEPVGAKSITWNNDTNPSNMNDFVVAGVYDLKGEHTRMDDNLPILNTGGGHTFNARLTVLDSSITGSGNSDDKCITQVLSFNNRLGQGEVYIRTGKGSSLDNLTWEKWSTLQRNVNVGDVRTLDNLIDNGIYSGVLTGTGETFVLVVINNYAVVGNNMPRSISQFKYSVGPLGVISFGKRVKIGNADFPAKWDILNQKEISSMISAEIKNITDGIDPEKIDSIKDIVAWIEAHGGDVTAIYNAINVNTLRISDEVKRATTAEANIKSNAMQYDTLGVNVYADKAEIYCRSITTTPRTYDIPAATTTNAGVMSAADKEKLDSLSQGGGSGGGGDITAVPTDVVIEKIEPNLVSTAIRKTPQVLTDSEKEIARENIGAVSYSQLTSAINNAITETLNTAV